MRSRRATTSLAALAAVCLIAAACGSDSESNADSTAAETTASESASTEAVPDDTEPPEATEPTPETTEAEVVETTAAASGPDVLVVPDDYDTIQAAVDAAAPGDLVLIQPGVYNEAVDVTTDDLTIRGVDRNQVVLDGQLELDNGIRVLGASGVAVENLTAANYTNNGLFWISSSGYRASYITTHRTGDYGIYAFDSVVGQIEHSYTAGSKDAGVYVGQCYPCDAVLDDITSEHNGLGYSGTNSGGNLLIVNSTFRNNRVGVVPNSGSYELCYPERETTIVGNIIHSNNQGDTPAIDVALLAQGNGIVVAGGIRNVVERNLVFDHDRTGIALTPFLEEDANDDLPTEDEWGVSCEDAKLEAPVVPDGALLWDSYENRVIGNVVSDSRVADIGVGVAEGDASGLRNCWSDNVFETSAPANLEVLAPCGPDSVGAGSGDWTVGALNVLSWLAEQSTMPPSVDWQTAPLPEIPVLENMPDPEGSPPRPATDVPYDVDLDAIAVPEAPAS